ncbi:MAG: molybdopterin synthase catalytic subunit, partial [Alishewanella sp. 34-51-39]
MSLRIVVQQQDFSVASEYERLRQDARYGAVVTFTGLVRELAEAELLSMTLEHYPGMTEQALTQIATAAQQRWQLGAVTIIHRVGTLLPNEQIVFVGVASAHRAAGFAAGEFIMDYLKNRAPFWKKEHT